MNKTQLSRRLRNKRAENDKPTFDCLQSMPRDESANGGMHVKVTNQNAKYALGIQRIHQRFHTFIHNRFAW